MQHESPRTETENCSAFSLLIKLILHLRINQFIDYMISPWWMKSTDILPIQVVHISSFDQKEECIMMMVTFQGLSKHVTISKNLVTRERGQIFASFLWVAVGICKSSLIIPHGRCVSDSFVLSLGFQRILSPPQSNCLLCGVQSLTTYHRIRPHETTIIYIVLELKTQVTIFFNSFILIHFISLSE